MKFTCPGCGITFSVAADKIPKEKEVKIVCPRCKERFDISSLKASEQSIINHRDSTFAEAAGSGEIPDDAPPLEIVEEGVKSSLLCISDSALAEKVEPVLQSMDLHVSLASQLKTAVSKLHHNQYDLVVVEDKYEGRAIGGNRILLYIHQLPMHLRRRFLVCIVGDKLPTLHRQLAFRLGVDLTINTADLDLERAKTILIRGMKEFESLYRIFKEELSKKGLFY